MGYGGTILIPRSAHGKRYVTYTVEKVWLNNPRFTHFPGDLKPEVAGQLRR